MSELFTYTFSFNPHCNPVIQVQSLTFFYRWGNWGIKGLRLLSKVTQLVNDGDGIRTQAVWLQNWDKSSLPYIASHPAVFLKFNISNDNNDYKTKKKDFASNLSQFACLFRPDCFQKLQLRDHSTSFFLPLGCQGQQVV